MTGSDLVETNTFSAGIASDYHMEGIVHDLNVASAKLAREAADETMSADPSRKCLLLVQLDQLIDCIPFPGCERSIFTECYF